MFFIPKSPGIACYHAWSIFSFTRLDTTVYHPLNSSKQKLPMKGAIQLHIKQISHCFIAYVCCFIANPAKIIRIILVCSWNDIHMMFIKVQFSCKCIWLIWILSSTNCEKITEMKHEWRNKMQGFLLTCLVISSCNTLAFSSKSTCHVQNRKGIAIIFRFNKDRRCCTG